MPNGETDTINEVEIPSEIGVRVLFFSVLREQVGTGEMAVSLPDDATGDTLLDRLAERCPALGAYRPVVRLAVNEQYAAPGTRLHDGDEVALITPVSGG